MISYESWPFSDREKYYPAIENEALAVMFATDDFRTYLLGRNFILVTDHSVLSSLQLVEPKGCMGQWVMDLQEYDFTVLHGPGSANGNADAISRLPLQEPLPLNCICKYHH